MPWSALHRSGHQAADKVAAAEHVDHQRRECRDHGGRHVDVVFALASGGHDHVVEGHRHGGAFNIWNDFLFGASFSTGESAPMTVALNNVVMTSTGEREYNVHMAAAVIAALPTLMVYVFGGRYFVRGLMAGSVKG